MQKRTIRTKQQEKDSQNGTTTWQNERGNSRRTGQAELRTGRTGQQKKQAE
jgi:hypothetical protein